MAFEAFSTWYQMQEIDLPSSVSKVYELNESYMG